MHHDWKAGPLPAGTYHFGGIVKVGEGHRRFDFCEFLGDHVKLDSTGEIVQADEIAQYNNCLELPPLYPSATRKD